MSQSTVNVILRAKHTGNPQTGNSPGEEQTQSETARQRVNPRQAQIRQNEITGKDQDAGKQTMNKAKLDSVNLEWLRKVAFADTVINTKQYSTI